MKGLWSLLVKSGPGDLNRQEKKENRAHRSEEDQETVRRGRLNRESRE